MNSIIQAAPAFLLFAYTTKLVIFGAGMPDALIVAFLCSLVGIGHLIEHINIKTITQEQLSKFGKELETHKATLTAQDEKVKEAISYVSNQKLKSVLGVR